MYSALILSVFLAAGIVYGLVEYVRHQRNLRRIPVRIHINGTRGKSSVTRLIGAGLRRGGIRAVTKVTGTFPRLVLEDGSETSIHRRGDANIIEQVGIVEFAAQRSAAALVIECMALEPLYQRITERQMLRAHVGVITNVRLDHVDVMGSTVEAIAGALAETIPAGGHLFTGEAEAAALLRERAARLGAELHASDGSTVTDEEMRGFPYIEHPSNVALALDVCRHLGVDRSAALAGMHSALPDAGVLRRFRVTEHGREMVFYNAFAANDPDSTLMIWTLLADRGELQGRRIVLLNTRQDRMDRARQLARMVGGRLRDRCDAVVLIGEATEVVRGMVKAAGMPPAAIVPVGWTGPEQVFERLLGLTVGTSTIVGIGNMGGMGAGVAEYFQHRSRNNHG
ncbi:MAG: poly-gamma-glutamate synthase PgsB [Bacteroidota bacterium]